VSAHSQSASFLAYRDPSICLSSTLPRSHAHISRPSQHQGAEAEETAGTRVDGAACDQVLRFDPTYGVKRRPAEAVLEAAPDSAPVDSPAESGSLYVVTDISLGAGHPKRPLRRNVASRSLGRAIEWNYGATADSRGGGGGGWYDRMGAWPVRAGDSREMSHASDGPNPLRKRVFAAV
jgi:hypothetical protein